MKNTSRVRVVGLVLSLTAAAAPARAQSILPRTVFIDGQVQTANPPKPSIGPAPYLVMIGGNVADLWTTKAALDTGNAHEGNPAWVRQNIATLTVVKVCGVAAITVVMRVLETHGHPKAARIVGYVDGAVTFGVAAHNLRVARQP